MTICDDSLVLSDDSLVFSDDLLVFSDDSLVLSDVSSAMIREFARELRSATSGKAAPPGVNQA